VDDLRVVYPQNLTHSAVPLGPSWLCAFGPAVLRGCILLFQAFLSPAPYACIKLSAAETLLKKWQLKFKASTGKVWVTKWLCGLPKRGLRKGAWLQGLHCICSTCLSVPRTYTFRIVQSAFRGNCLIHIWSLVRRKHSWPEWTWERWWLNSIPLFQKTKKSWFAVPLRVCSLALYPVLRAA